MFRPLLAAVALAAGALPAAAQECPTAQRIIVGFAAGGGADQQARLLAERLAARTGRTVIVENRTGAGGNVASEFVAKAVPDGCTLMLTGNNHNINPLLYARAGYDPQKDFAAVIRTVEAPSLMSASASQPFKTVAGLVEYARANPRKLSYSSSGIGTVNHIGMELLLKAAKIEMVHIPYKGAAQALTDSVSGVVPVANGSVTASQPHVVSGKLVALSVGGSRRSAVFPDVPTIAEAGYPAATFIVWNGIFAPAGTPLAVRERLNADIRAILADKAFHDRLVANGWEPAPSTVAEFEAFLAEDYRQSRSIMQDLKLKAE